MKLKKRPAGFPQRSVSCRSVRSRSRSFSAAYRFFGPVPPPKARRMRYLAYGLRFMRRRERATRPLPSGFVNPVCGARYHHFAVLTRLLIGPLRADVDASVDRTERTVLSKETP